MMHRNNLLLALFAILLNTSSAIAIPNLLEATETSMAPNVATTVPPEKKFLEKNPDETAKRHHIFYKDFYLLTRPNDPNYVALISLNLRTGEALLNPAGGNYSPLPQLDKMTLETAEKFWGKNQAKINEGFRTYQLVSNATDHPVYLDVVFENHLLVKYRIRAQIVSAVKWIEIKRKQAS